MTDSARFRATRALRNFPYPRMVNVPKFDAVANDPKTTDDEFTSALAEVLEELGQVVKRYSSQSADTERKLQRLTAQLPGEGKAD